MVFCKARYFLSLLALPLCIIYFQFVKVSRMFSYLEDEIDLFSPARNRTREPSTLRRTATERRPPEETDRSDAIAFLGGLISSRDREREDVSQFSETNSAPRAATSDSENYLLDNNARQAAEDAGIVADALQSPAINSNSVYTHERLILMTFSFGEQTAAKKALRMFIESSRNAGVDFVIIGDTPPIYKLPENFRFFKITWDDFVDRVFEKTRDGKETTKLRKANFRKLCDFTPVMGFLFPELADGYDWWGHIDSDMIVGNISKFVPQNVLQNHDIISGHHKMPVWGPFTLFRNTPAVNELFKLCPEPLEKNLLNMGNNYFDEWGNNNKALRFNYSIAGIITNEGPRLGLRVAIGVLGDIMWDKAECLFKYGGKDENIPAWCHECVYDKGTLTRGRDGQELIFCHFHASKKRPQHEESLSNEAKLRDLIETQQFRCAWQEGFDYLDTPEAQALKAKKEGHVSGAAHHAQALDASPSYPIQPTNVSSSSEPINRGIIQRPMSAAAFYDHHYERITALINTSTVLSWNGRSEKNAFGPLYEQLGYVYRANGVKDPDLKASKYFFWGSICEAAKAFTQHRRTEGAVPLPHVLFFRMNENWGGFSEAVPGKTAEWVRELAGSWRKQGCSKEFIFEYLDHPETLHAFTVQFQVYDHPKVDSIPLGLRDLGQAKVLLRHLHEGKVERTQLLMINSKPRAMRDATIEKVTENFHGSVSNTYGVGGRVASFDNYYIEMKRSKFILSPGGLGFDCYRHYEALYMGTIPVLEHLNRSDAWFHTFDDLPVAWIDSFENLTPEFLKREYTRITGNAHNYKYEKLTKSYWVNFVKSFVDKPSDEREPKAISQQIEPNTGGKEVVDGVSDPKWDGLVKTFYQKQFDNLNDIEVPNMLLWGARHQVFGYSYKFFLDRFPYNTISEGEQDVSKLVKTSPFVFSKSICHAAKAFQKHWSQDGAEPLPHILLFRFHEDNGGFVIGVEGKTKFGYNSLEVWKRQGCTQDFIWDYLDHPDTIVAFTNQYQAFYHPKVYSVPIGIRFDSECKLLKKNLLKSKDQPWTSKKKMLMINSKARPQRAPILDSIISRFQNFGVPLENTYDNKGGYGKINIEYFSEMRESRFIVSPSGSGWDCYRHYEAIFLGAIPIIEHANRTDGWYRSLDNLPVAWIDSYENLTPKWLENEYHRILENQDSINYKKMTNQWWIDFVYSHLNNSLAREDPAKYWTEMSKPGGLAGGFEAAYFESHPEHVSLKESSIRAVKS